jgi:peptide/nickel transport system ATP-binding protein
MTPALSIRDLVVDYGDKRAVDSVSLDVMPGEIVGLAGESGSGKSTLMMGALRLLRPPAVIRGGEVRLGDRDLLAMRPAELNAIRWREVSLVMQSALDSLNPVLTVGEQLVETLRAHPPHPAWAEARRRAAELVEMVGLEKSALARFPFQLSGGQRQRVGVALALALTPKLVVLDEPTTALDVVVQREVLRRLLDLRDELGFAVVFVTHDLPLLLHLADRVGVMRHGRMVELGPAADILTRPSHPYTRELLAAIPSIDGPVREVS